MEDYSLDIRERQKHHLNSLLRLKKDNEGITVKGLQRAILDAVAVMEQEDVARVEKVMGVNAM